MFHIHHLSQRVGQLISRAFMMMGSLTILASVSLAQCPCEFNGHSGILMEGRVTEPGGEGISETIITVYVLETSTFRVTSTYPSGTYLFDREEGLPSGDCTYFVLAYKDGRTFTPPNWNFRTDCNTGAVLAIDFEGIIEIIWEGLSFNRFQTWLPEDETRSFLGRRRRGLDVIEG